MAYPYAMTTGTTYPLMNSPEVRTHVPFYVGTNTYVVCEGAENSTATGKPLKVLQSTDAGQTWAVADAANQPNIPPIQFPANELQGWSVYNDQDRDRLLVTYVPFGSSSFVVHPFDGSAGTWGTPTAVGPPAVVMTNTTTVTGTTTTTHTMINPVDPSPLALTAPLGTNSYITFYQYMELEPSSVSLHAGIKYQVYASGTWGAAQDFLTPGGDEITYMSYWPEAVHLGAAGTRVHYIAGNPSTGYVRKVYNTGTALGYYRLDHVYPRYTFPYGGAHQPFLSTLCDQVFITLPSWGYRTNHTSTSISDEPDHAHQPVIHMLEDVDTLTTWKVDLIAHNYGSGFEIWDNVNWNYIGAAYHPTAESIHIFYPIYSSATGTDGTYTNTWDVYTACSKGYTYTEPASMFTVMATAGGTNAGAGGNIEFIVPAFNGTTLGMVLANYSGDEPYDHMMWYQTAVSTCGAGGCTPAAASTRYRAFH